MNREIDPETDDIYSRWYIYYPVNILLGSFGIVLMLMSGSEHKPTSGIAILFINPYTGWGLILFFGLAIVVKLFEDFWKYQLFKNALSVISIGLLIFGGYLLIMQAVALPISIAIIAGAIIIALVIALK